MKLLKNNKDKLLKLSKELLVKETMSAKESKLLLGLN